jgi:hypothetical protein
MANDIIDINVTETVETVAITVNPNLTTVNINRQVPVGVNGQDLQSVTDIGSVTTNSITANSFIKSDGTASQILAANGSVITAGTNITISGGTISSTGGGGSGTTNLTTTQTASNFTINSDTGTDASVPLGNGTLAGATLNDYTTAEKTKLSGIATGAEVNVNADWNAVSGDAQILNKPTIPITIVNGNSLFSTGLDGTGTGATDAVYSIFLGENAGQDATNASYSNFMGYEAGYRATGVEGVEFRSNFIGFQAGKEATDASYSNFFGFTAGEGATDAGNSNFFGSGTGNGATNANNSNFFGEEAGFNATRANNSNFFGNSAGFGSTDAYLSNFFGTNAGFQASSASYSNLFGHYAGSSFTDNNIGSNNIIIGTNISLPDAAVDSINLGGVLFGTGTNSYLSGDPSIVPVSSGKIGIGVVNPTNTLHIYSEAEDTSGLRLERLTSASPSSTGKLIGVDSSGNVVTLEGAGGGGSSVNYYLNGGTSQGTFGGTTYYEFSKTAVIGTGADFTINTNGYIASFITDVADPSLLLIPAGNWNLEFFFSSSSAGGSPSFYTELYKYDGTTFTLIASGSVAPEGITNGTAIDAYFTALAVPETILTVNDRLAIRVYVNASSKTITLHTQNGHLCEVITTFTAGLTALNGLQTQVQNFSVGTSGTDFAINSSGSTHTFNLPTASASNRGALSSANWTTFNNKQDTLQNTVNIKSINGNTILGSGDLVISGTGISSLNGLTGATQTFSVFTNFIGSPSFSSTGINHQLKLPNAGPTTDYGLITNTSQSIGGGKTFIDSISIPAPVPANPISVRCIVLGDSQGGLIVGSTTNYPTGQEMQYVKGITSSVQTQLNGKASELNVAEQTYSLSPTFTGTAPTIISSSTYQWNQVGTLVTGRVNLIYTTPGSISQVVIPLPADMPTPLSPTGLSGALDILYYGVGMFNTLTTSIATVGRTCLLRRNVTNTGYEFVITHSAAVSSRVISLTLQYFT